MKYKIKVKQPFEIKRISEIKDFNQYINRLEECVPTKITNRQSIEEELLFKLEEKLHIIVPTKLLIKINRQDLIRKAKTSGQT